MLFMEQQFVQNQRLERHTIIVIGKNALFLPPLSARKTRLPHRATCSIRIRRSLWDSSAASNHPSQPIPGTRSSSTVSISHHRHQLRVSHDLDTGHDPHISHGTTFQCREGCLITRAIVHSDRMLFRIKFDHYSTFRLPCLISFCGRATR
jgi:hypothetical protein